MNFNKKLASLHKEKPHICFHPEGHFKGKELKEFKKWVKSRKPSRRSLGEVELKNTRR